MRAYPTRWLPVAAWAIFILIGTSITLPGGPDRWSITSFDKLIHATIYGVLALLLFETLQKDNRAAGWKAFGLALALASVYGGLDEFHQYFIPTRQMDVWDWVADTLGAGLALATRMGWQRTFWLPVSS